MQKVSKKDIQVAVEKIIEQAFAQYEIPSPSKKTKKIVKEVSKKVSSRIKREVTKKFKKDRKAASRESRKNDKVKKITTAA